MATDQKVGGAGTIKTDEFVKADPTLNPRNIAAKEIWAKRNEQADIEAQETMPQDDAGDEFEPAPTKGGKPNVDGDVTIQPEGEPSLEEPAVEDGPKPEAETTAQAAPETSEDEGVDTIEPDAVYEVTVDGKKVEVEGAKLIEAGIRTYQKEAAADVKLALANERLQTASKLLEEAQRRSAAPSQGTPPVDDATKRAQEDATAAEDDIALAKAIQFGTEEQAAAALKKLRATGRAVSPEQIGQFVQSSVPMIVRQELMLNEARQYASTEFSDIMEKPLLKSLFDAMEMQARQNGDQTPPRELYGKIGEVIRTQLGMQKPQPKAVEPQSREQRVAAKKAAPTMPRTALARLEGGNAAPKVPTTSDIIARMASLRGQGSLTSKPH